jgi:hypothetical protein
LRRGPPLEGDLTGPARGKAMRFTMVKLANAMPIRTKGSHSGQKTHNHAHEIAPVARRATKISVTSE